MPKIPLEACELELSHNGKPVTLLREGLLGKLAPGTFSFIFDISKPDVVPFTVRSHDKRLLGFRQSRTLPNRYYYPIAIGINGKTSPYPKNSVRFLQCSPQGDFTVWELGITFRKGQHQVVYHKQYAGYCYTELKEVVCPLFRSWPNMHILLEKLMAPYLSGLATFSPAIHVQQEFDVGELNDNEAEVKWYNPLLGEGYLVASHKGVWTEAWVHWSDIVDGGVLVPGMYVSFERIEPFRVTSAKGKYKERAYGVKRA